MRNHSTRILVKRSLRFAVLDGAAASAMMGLTQNYITPFALALKATTVQIGLLSSFPNFAMAFSQLATPALVEKLASRKKLILPAVLIHALVWVPAFLLPWLFPDIGVWLLIGLFTFGSIAGAVVNPAWQSMMADLVPIKVRGRYFSFRGRVFNFTILFFTLGAGLLLQRFTDNVFLGFAMLFGGATLFRLLSLYFLSRMYDPPLEQDESNKPGLVSMITSLGKSNTGKYTLFMSLVYFTMMISGPFFSVYLIRDLELDYITYTIISCSGTVATLLFLPFWGRRADRAGNLKIIRITGALMPLVPLLFLASTNPIYLIAANAFGGFVWSGFDLASINFLYDTSDPKTRTKQIAVFNAITSIALSLGALTGGYIAPQMPDFLGYQIRSLFTISGVLRGVVVFLALRAVTEVRHVPKIGTLNLILGRKNHNHLDKYNHM